MRIRDTLLLTSIFISASFSSAHAVELDSGDKQVALVELFTSEGCSSCPPADRWLSTLRNDTRLWKSVVPIAFHVDYWDYIGWPDRFAVPAHAQRQRVHREVGNVHSVYTPGFVVAGQEWRGWFRNPDLRLEQQPSAGRLRVKVSKSQLSVQYKPTGLTQSADLELTFALLGMGLNTTVKAGENDGRNLAHDFVVLHTQRWKMQPGADGFVVMEKIRLPRTEAKELAVALWVSETGTQKPLQATGGLLN
jgi:hypothetical protein